MTGLQGLGIVLCITLWALETMCLFGWWVRAMQHDREDFDSWHGVISVFILSTLAWLAIVAHIVRVW